MNETLAIRNIVDERRKRYIRGLHALYGKQVQKSKDFRILFMLSGFVAMFLAVLYYQRSASVAYQVTSTLEAVILPNTADFQDPTEIYSWLNNLVTTVWPDPVCGNGLCEAPFEFPAYSTYGCKADCGLLNEVENLISIQIDITFDFSHPPGSLSALALQQQASWNLCPSSTAYNPNCYYSSDQTFNTTSGQQHVSLDDVPPGQWYLAVNGDIFNKVQGAARDASLVASAGFIYKVYIAYTAAIAEQQYEMGILQEIEAYGQQTLFTYINNSLQQSYGPTTVGSDGQLFSDFELQQLQAASCVCGNEPVSANETAVWDDDNLLVAPFNNTADPANTSRIFNQTAEAYTTGTYCSGSNAPASPLFMEYYNLTEDGVLLQGPVAPGVNYITINETVSASSNLSQWCQLNMNKLFTWRTSITQTVQNLAVNARVKGRSSQGHAANLNLYNYMVANYPELLDAAYNQPTGVDPTDPIACSLAALIPYYATSPYYSTRPQNAADSLDSTAVYVPDITILALASRATARIAEIQFELSNTSSIVIPPPAPGYSSVTLARLNSLFVAANATNVTLPNANDTNLQELRIDYNLAQWSGGAEEYLTCNLDSRGLEYIGQCIDMQQSCVPTQSYTTPYNCTLLINGTQVEGDISETSYRADCEAPCNRQSDCSAICECFGSCLGTQICECTACTQLGYDAAADPQFESAAAYYTGNITIAPLTTTARHSRRLQSSVGSDPSSKLPTTAKAHQPGRHHMSNKEDANSPLSSSTAAQQSRWSQSSSGSGTDSVLAAVSQLQSQLSRLPESSNEDETSSLLAAASQLQSELSWWLEYSTETDSSSFLAAVSQLHLELSRLLDYSAKRDISSSMAATSQLHAQQSRRLQGSTGSDPSSLLTAAISQLQSEQYQIAYQEAYLDNEVQDTTATVQSQVVGDLALNSLITAQMEAMAENQASIQALLAQVIAIRNKELEVEAQTQAAVVNLNSLAGSLSTQTDALAAAVQNQQTTISVSLAQGTIDLPQAYSLWTSLRRQNAQSGKTFTLSNTPCSTNQVSSFNFQLDLNLELINATRDREVGLSNRVVAGMLLYQWRTHDAPCPDSKFGNLQDLCPGDISTDPYGIDPVFNLGTQLFNPNYYSVVDNTNLIQFYNCSLLPNATYNVYDPTLEQIANQPPYCAELYNPESLPYAFHAFPLQGKTPGYPVWFDINLSQEGIQQWLAYVTEGLYLDNHTQGVTAEMITYNADVQTFSYIIITFDFGEGGSISTTFNVYTVYLQLYDSVGDHVRFAAEIAVFAMIIGMLVNQGLCMYKTFNRHGSPLPYFASFWVFLDGVSNMLLAVTMIIWWIFAFSYAGTFSIDMRYDVYVTLQPDANFLELEAGGDNLLAAWSAFQSLASLISLLDWYYFLVGVNILLLLARLLRRMDFQPRLGVLTRTLWLATPILLHFVIVFGIVFVCFATMAHIVFGTLIPEFSSLTSSLNECFELMLLNIGVNEELRQLGGLMSIAGSVFFWTFMVLVYMVLFNFLLAIIIDAFTSVKESTSEEDSMFSEVYDLLRDSWQNYTAEFDTEKFSGRKLHDLLKSAGGEEDECGDTVEPEAEEEVMKVRVLDEDMDEDSIRGLFTRIRAQTQGPGHENSPTGTRIRCLGSPKVIATEEEVDLAAKRLMSVLRREDSGDAKTSENTEEVAKMMKPSGALMDSGLEEQQQLQFASALQNLIDVQRTLAEAQRNVMQEQKAMAELQAQMFARLEARRQSPPAV